jgi:hypothetical protein
VNPGGWYVFIHQVPARPLYLRAKVRQRLDRLGALSLKNSVYALPQAAGAQGAAELRQIGRDVDTGGGESFLLEASFADPPVEDALVARARAERAAEYRDVAAALRREARAFGRRADIGAAAPALRLRAARARRRLDSVRARDFFAAPGSEEAAAALEEVMRLAEDAARPAPGPRGAEWIGRAWVTRQGVLVDRIASAWFIRRFLDPRARFRFVDPHDDPAQPGELRFDMRGGDFTHEGDACTLETLIARTSVRDRALQRVAEIVHDVDLKDGKFARPEARGVEQLLLGIVRAHAADEARLEHGFALFDSLYESFRGRVQGGAG